ncbi:MAG: YegS/Rv2252/BmrU family lipid kinase [Planctomycetaceae bacterium]|nr:YegS/Rv2252/BmrU family lipid kinase [Planctomycetaceae bacterium]
MIDTLRTVVMWNPSAGSADKAAEVRRSLTRMPHVTIREPVGRKAAIESTIQEADSGAELIVAAGGDGTVSSIVEGISQAKSDPVLGILPLGTGNDLARALGISLSPQDALQVFTNGRELRIDVMEIASSSGTRICTNMLTGGNTGRYLERMTDEVKQRWGPLCYLRGVIDVVIDLQTYRVNITCDDEPEMIFDSLNMFVANGKYSGGGLAVSPDAVLNDGMVDVIIVRDGDPRDIASLTTEYIAGDYFAHDLIEFRRARRIRLTADPSMPLTADGDEIGTTPLSVRVLHEALRVIVPQDTDR